MNRHISFIFNILRDFSSGSVWELYLLSVMILIALFCNLMSLCVLINPYSAGVPLMGRFKNQTQPNVIIDIYF